MREYVVSPVEEEPQKRYGPRVYQGDGQWATVFEVVYAAEDWFRRNEAAVPITARRREWEFTEVTWPSGQTGRVGIECDTVLGTGVVGANGAGITQAMNALFGAAIVPELDGRWMPIGQLRGGDRIVGWSSTTRPDVMDVTGVDPSEDGMVALWSEQRGGPSLRWANEWVRLGAKEDA